MPVCRCDGLNLQPKVTARKLFGCKFFDLKLSVGFAMVVGPNRRHEKARTGRALSSSWSCYFSGYICWSLDLASWLKPGTPSVLTALSSAARNA